jgi:Flp pilus assembly protein TadD
VISVKERQQLDVGALRLLELYEQGEHAHLLNEVEQLSKEGAPTPAMLGLAALSLTALERHADALKAAGQAVEHATDRAWLYAALAGAQAGASRWEEAVWAQERAVQLMPGEPGYLVALARYQRLAGAPEQAVRTARRAWVADAAHPGALVELGLALAATGDPEGALAQFRAAQAAAPAEPAGWLNEGMLLLQAGDHSGARQALHRALAVKPGLEDAENGLAATLGAKPVILHLLVFGRLNTVGWLIVAFLYYLFFRLLEFVWKLAPATYPAFRVLLGVSLLYLLAVLAGGRLLRAAFHRGWPA